MESELMGDALLEKITQIRGDFPFYGKSMDDPDYWIFLDNAATTHKPRCVLDAITDFYVNYNANIHRGLYELSEKATSAYEEARKRIAGFIGARSDAEVVFTRGATESINLIASCWGGQNLAKGDFILVSEMEHHANIVPWQLVAEATGAEVLPIPIDDVGNLDLSFAEEKIKSGQVKCLSLVHVSNAIGVRVDVEPLVKLAKANGVFTLIDGSQALSHFAVNVTDLDCDAYVFSGHKLFGPTGIGILWAREEILKAIPPYQGGGDMIHRVSFEGTTFSEPPSKFEAGTPHISGAIGLGRAVEYVQSIGYQTIAKIDELLLKK
ncbi:MAG: aminotransferase class V-fold PLP-dependent enzyme, partial [Opitutales bacterium]|nr:aminotransferase class V-fold PLP-dependent enzyme [Opitutales bacterium]